MILFFFSFHPALPSARSQDAASRWNLQTWKESGELHLVTTLSNCSPVMDHKWPHLRDRTQVKWPPYVYIDVDNVKANAKIMLIINMLII